MHLNRILAQDALIRLRKEYLLACRNSMLQRCPNAALRWSGQPLTIDNSE
jgi:hypothetical protein